MVRGKTFTPRSVDVGSEQQLSFLTRPFVGQVCRPSAVRGFATSLRLLNTHPVWDALVPKDSTYVGGSWIKASLGKTFTVFNPATDEPLRTIPCLGATEASTAIDVASQVQPEWASKSPNHRSDVIRRWAAALRLHRESLAQLITSENGKTLADARGEIDSGIDSLEWYADEAKRVYGLTVPSLSSPASRQQFVHLQPVGVVGMITPWNFPLSMITRKAGAALAAGCAVVLKPAEDTPLSALALVRLAVEEAKLPAGLFSVLTTNRDPDGAEAIGNIFCSSPAVRLIGFTGSTTVGQKLYQKAASHGKRVQLELGGNAPFIVFGSANLDRAVAGAVACKFRCSGQTCVTANRIYVEESIYTEFTNRFAKSVSRLTMGDGSLPDTKLGPLINRAAVDKVHQLVESAKVAGAEVVHIANQHPPTSDAKGCFYPATILSNCHADMNCVHQEIFGPVASLIRFIRYFGDFVTIQLCIHSSPVIIGPISFSSESKVLESANHTPYGLAGYCYTQNMDQAWRMATGLQFGMIAINSPRVSSAEMPFGGIKDSGIGREGGPHALTEFMNTKTIGWDIVSSTA